MWDRHLASVSHRRQAAREASSAVHQTVKSTNQTVVGATDPNLTDANNGIKEERDNTPSILDYTPVSPEPLPSVRMVRLDASNGRLVLDPMPSDSVDISSTTTTPPGVVGRLLAPSEPRPVIRMGWLTASNGRLDFTPMSSA